MRGSSDLENDMFSKVKKFVLTTALVSLGAISCSSCKTTAPSISTATPTVSVAPPAPPPPATVTIAKDNWSFTLPGSGWAATEGKTALSTVLVNKEKHNMIVMISEKTESPAEEYVMAALGGIRASGATLIAVKQVTLRNLQFVLFESAKDNVRVWTWVTVAGSQGYGFSCGGPAAEDSQRELCASIANTLKIN
jgi:hypothetical protein